MNSSFLSPLRVLRLTKGRLHDPLPIRGQHLDRSRLCISLFLHRLEQIHSRVTFPQSVTPLSTWVNHYSLRSPVRLLTIPLNTLSALLVSESSIEWASVYPLSLPSWVIPRQFSSIKVSEHWEVCDISSGASQNSLAVQVQHVERAMLRIIVFIRRLSTIQTWFSHGSLHLPI